MQHLKNIKSGNPKQKEQYQLTKNFDVIWLWSEDGKNWYEESEKLSARHNKDCFTMQIILLSPSPKMPSTLNPEGYSVVDDLISHTSRLFA